MNEDQTRSNGFQESAGNGAEQPSTADQSPGQFDKEELDWLVRSLRLTKEQCVVLLESLKETNKLKAGIDVHVYDQEIMRFFGRLMNGTEHIKDVPGWFNWLNYDYEDPSDWALEIKYDQSKKSLKCTLTDTLGRYNPLTFLESDPKIEVTEPFEMLREVLENVGYKAQGGWKLRGDFSAKLARHFQSLKINGDQPNECAPAYPDLLGNGLAAAAVDVEMDEDQTRSNGFQESAENGAGQPSVADQSSGQFDKEELDFLVAILNLTTEQCVVLMKTLKKTNRLKPGIDEHMYENWEQEILHFFGRLTNGTRYIKDVPGLFNWTNYYYEDPSEWELEIKYDQTKKSLRCTLTDTLEVYDPLTFLESNPEIEVTEPFEMLREVLENVGYKAQGGWKLRGDFSAKLERHFQSSSPAERRPQA